MPIGLAYCRQSRAREAETASDSLSLDAQEAEIRRWAARNQWTVDRVIRDHDLSGGTLDRPGWQEVRALVAGGGYDGVLTVAVSRVARDNLLQEMAWRELQSLGSTIISLAEPNLEDDMLRGILGVFGQAERKRISRFVTAAIHERKRRGLHHGLPPFGMRLSGRPGERNRLLEPDPATAPIAREMVDRLLSGQTTHMIYCWLRDSAVPSSLCGRWSPEAVRKWFGRPSLAGLNRIDGALVPALHTGIVTPDEFARMQQIIAASRYRHAHVRMESWVRGLAYHGCGARMTANTSTQASGNRYLSFMCPDDRCAIRPRKGSARKLEAAATRCLLADLSALLGPQDALQAWSRAHDGQVVSKTRQRLSKERERIRATHDRAESLYLSGRRDASWLAEQDALYTTRDREIAAELAALDVPPDVAILTAAHQAAREWATSWAALPLEAKSVTLRQIGVLWVAGDELTIRYSDRLAPMIPSPSVVCWR